MHRSTVRRAAATLLAIAIGLITGCPFFSGDGDGSGNNSTGDTTAPTFGGAVTVTASGMTRAVISWNAASDDQTAQAEIVYRIFMAAVGDPQTTGSAAFTTGPGVTSFEVTGLPLFQNTRFVVRAEDEAGNVDANTVVKGISLTAVEWNLVDGSQASGINDGWPIRSTAIATAGGSLYVMWNEPYETYIARVKKYGGNDDAPVWTDADDGEFDGLNYNPSAEAGQSERQVSLASFGGRLYAAWPEYTTATFSFQIRVASYDPADPGQGWVYVEQDPAGDIGINWDATSSGSDPVLLAAGGQLVAVWIETWGEGQNQVRVAAYNGNDSAPSWSFIDGNEETGTGINVDTNQAAYTPAAAYVDGHIVVAWIESGLVRARAYNGSSWSTIDGGDGLNYAMEAYYPALQVAGGRLYAAWQEYSETVTQIRVAVFGGSWSSPAWSFVDGGGSTGANADTTNPASWAHLAELNGGLLLFMSQSNGSFGVLRARAFNGDPVNPAWLTIDGGSANGLNYSPDYDSFSISATEMDDRIYVTWAEGSGYAATETRVIVGR